MTDPSLLIVILNYRTAELTLRAAAEALADSRDMRAEIVIVDNDSRDGSLGAISAAISRRGWDADNRVRLIDAGRNGGFGAGNNVGIRAGLSDGSRADFVYLLNSDAWPEPGTIRTLLDFMQDRPTVGMAGSAVRGEDGVDHQTAFRFPSIAGEFESCARIGPISRLLARHIVALPCYETATRVDWVAGASLMMRMDMLDRIGLFDETFFLYFEETELCRRAARAGWECWYLPAGRVIHIGSVSTGMKNWARVPTYWFDSRQHYFIKVHGRTYWMAATLAHVGGSLLFRLRQFISRRKVDDPPHFLRDLVVHSARNLTRSSGSEVRLAPRFLEDRQ
ncbi:glycosyltransferase family 2 protein [Pontibaca methylaminivorans]|uniref:Glycosyltransferase, GT2 family n=1 Tax=Pontibaca methylaminivorans TaxID=515897 RepID=A0A1R3WZY3_9RHOB|nr:glycosyltransferase family 2 protein [Pontibaca methylaminivorans]SIT84094.1 Glycosyltransferase, GT2 family [Pontibaca methylaminivorans]